MTNQLDASNTALCWVYSDMADTTGDSVLYYGHYYTW